MRKVLLPRMKKRVLVFLLIFVILLILGLVFKKSVFPTKTSQGGVRVTLDAYPPNLIVSSPVNIDYSNDRIELKYSVSDSGSGVDAVWYNLDGGQNITLTEDTAITVSKGNHVLHIYAKDKAGLVNDTEFVTFFLK
ncbi:MAG: hypothetical protein ISS23_00760 [Nanoarchaeota archaeon]|nr:hypothetical protein [Nanoarchaeota archaeon]